VVTVAVCSVVYLFESVPDLPERRKSDETHTACRSFLLCLFDRLCAVQTLIKMFLGGLEEGPKLNTATLPPSGCQDCRCCRRCELLFEGGLGDLLLALNGRLAGQCFTKVQRGDTRRVAAKVTTTAHSSLHLHPSNPKTDRR